MTAQQNKKDFISSSHHLLRRSDDRLRQRSIPVDQVDADIFHFMYRMKDIMLTHGASGLAAPQLGVMKRVIVVRAGDALYSLANPEIIESSEKKSSHMETCLSLPCLTGIVSRPHSITVRFLNEFDKTQEMKASGFLAASLQHEIDHLNGVLFVDHLSS